MQTFKERYVAYCDILGFSNLVIADFEKTLTIYGEFKSELAKRQLGNLTVSLYSDSIIIVGDNVIEIAQTVQILLWTCLKYKWIVRGGIAYGKHWAESDSSNLFIISEALVKAAILEKTVKRPLIVVADEIEIGLEYWIHGFTHRVFDLPIIHYENVNIVNPFNNYWFRSAEMILTSLKLSHPNHHEKYEYLLKLMDDIKQEKEFVPHSIIKELLEKELIRKI